MTTPNDRPNLNRLRELDKDATPGPWDEDRVSSMTWPTQIDGWAHPGKRAAAIERIDANAALIAAYRNATPALVAALTDVLDMADEWSALSWLPEFPTYEDFAEASPARRTLWEAAENLRDAIHAHITETPAPDTPAHLDLTNGA